MGDTDVTHTRTEEDKKSADAWPEKRVKIFRERAKKERDSSENEWTLTKHLFFFFFFCRGTTFSLKTPLSSPQKSKTHQQPLLEITKKIMGVLRVKGTRVTLATRRARSMF